MNGNVSDYYNSIIRNNVGRKSRPEMSEAERLLWAEIRQKKLGVSFERKVKIGPYFVDFYAPKIKLVVQMNRRRHDTEEGRRKDAAFDDYLRKKGYKVLRFSSTEAIANINGVIQRILLQLYQTNLDEDTENPQGSAQG